MAYGGPRLYRFYNYEQLHYLPAPTAGWNPDANPWELGDAEAQVLDNFLIRPGKIIMRAPLSFAFSAGGGLPAILNVVGMISGIAAATTWTQRWWIMAGKIPSATSFVDNWNAPLVGPQAAATLGTAKTLNFQLGTAVTAAGTSPGPRSINFEGQIYGITYDAATSHPDAQGTYVAWDTNLYTYQYLGSGTTALTALTNAPTGAFDLKGYLSRIWLLCGRDKPGAGTTHNPTTLFFTNPGSTGLGSATADWQDPVSGLTNQLKMDNNAHDYGVALATTRNALLILRRSSIWALRGSTTASFTLNPISRDVGCIDARSVVETDRGVFFLSNQGLMLTDGATIRNISGPVEATLQSAILLQQRAVRNGFGGYATCVVASDGTIIVSIGQLAVTGGVPTGRQQPIWSAMFSPSSNTWSRLTSAVWSNSVDGMIQSGTNNYPGPLVQFLDKTIYALGDSAAYMVEDLANQVSIVSGTNGIVGTQTGLYDNGSSNFPIPAVWTSRFTPITTVRRQGQAKRFFLDYVFASSNPFGLPGWKAQPVDASNIAIGSPMSTVQGSTPGAGGSVSGLSLTPTAAIQHQNQDFTNEITDLALSVTWNDIARSPFTTNTVAEIYGAGVEYQLTRALR